MKYSGMLQNCFFFIFVVSRVGVNMSYGFLWKLEGYMQEALYGGDK